MGVLQPRNHHQYVAKPATVDFGSGAGWARNRTCEARRTAQAVCERPSRPAPEPLNTSKTDLKERKNIMSQETERRQGIFVIASFDRMFTRERKNQDGTFTQPPSGGCVLKLGNPHRRPNHALQPPSGDCVLKPVAEGAEVEVQAQPSSANHMSKPDCVFLI